MRLKWWETKEYLRYWADRITSAIATLGFDPQKHIYLIVVQFKSNNKHRDNEFKKDVGKKHYLAVHLGYVF